MSDKRIIELESISDVPADAYLVIDSVSGDTRKIKPIKIGATYEIEDGDHSFTLVGSNGYSHTVDIPYDSVSMTQAEYNALTPAQKADGTARFITDAESDVESELWSKVGRQTLDTDSQVLSNAVNELKGDMTQAQNDISELNSSLTNTNTDLQNLITQTGPIHWLRWLNGVTKIYDFLRNTNNPPGLYLADCQSATDNPFSGIVSIGLIYKASVNGSYSIAFIIAGNRLAISDQLGTTQTALTWHSKISPFG